MRTRDEDKVQLVKQRAMEMVVSQGFEGFSVNKLAKKCGISVGTLYIYYKDKDDLITKVAIEEATRMTEITLRGFSADMHFAEGLRLQWKNRATYMLENPVAMVFFEQLRTSTYQKCVMETIINGFRDVMDKFTKNAVKRGELNKMPLEVYWSIAFSPLYTLLRFHTEGRSIGGKTFVFNEKILWQTFELVLKALQP